MPTVPLPLSTFGEVASPDLFGGNILAPRTPMTGPNSHAEAVEALGVTTMRYPGGSLTESFFDISNPDARTATDNETGEQVDFMPISDLMAYAGDSGRAVTIVLPTRDQLSTTRFDDNGDRLPDVDAEALSGFVRDVVSGVYGDARVAGFEVGNEYWGSGRMNAAEYGRVAAEMTTAIDTELQALSSLYPEAADVEILVQQGTNFGFSSLDETYEGLSDADIIADLNATYDLDLPSNGGVNWTEVNNLIVLSQFDDPEVLEAVDGVISHVYSRGPDAAFTRYFQLDQIEDTWQAADPDLEIHVTEWNLRNGASSLNATEDYGLFQAQEMLEMVETFMAEGVDAAQVWPLIQNTDTALSLGFDYTASTPAGEMFSLMSANLPGMTMLNFSPGEARDAEYVADGLEVHGFADGQDMLFYITAPQGAGVAQNSVDISALVADVTAVEAVVLGVASGQAPGDTRSDAVLEELPPGDVYADGVIDAVLGAGEILQVRLIDVLPTDSFAPVFEQTAPDSGRGEAAALFEPASLAENTFFMAEPDESSADDAAGPTAAPPEEAAQDLMMVLGFSESGYAPRPEQSARAFSLDGDVDEPDPPYQLTAGRTAASQARDSVLPEPEPAWLFAALSGGGVGQMAPSGQTSVEPASATGARALFSPTEQLRPSGPDLMSLLSGGGESGGRSGFPDLVTADEAMEEAEDTSEFDDMGLGWALAAMPLLGLAGFLG
jgi:hypothetical protein